MHESEPQDEALRAAYRGLPREEPPSAIDGVVLGAARQSVARRPHKWMAPVSIAAVLVLSVAVTLRVADEHPETPMATPSPPASGEPTKSVVPQAESKTGGPGASPAPQVKTQARPALPSGDRAAKPEPPASAKEETSVATAPALVPSPQADAPERSQAATSIATAAPATGQSAGTIAQPGARADRRAPMAAKSSAEASNLASAAPSTPEAWIERIIELRASARHKEAEESYTEFRHRFPDYLVPPEKLQKMLPPR
jgi:hypothetical protein